MTDDVEKAWTDAARAAALEARTQANHATHQALTHELPSKLGNSDPSNKQALLHTRAMELHDAAAKAYLPAFDTPAGKDAIAYHSTLSKFHGAAQFSRVNNVKNREEAARAMSNHAMTVGGDKKENHVAARSMYQALGHDHKANSDQRTGYRAIAHKHEEAAVFSRDSTTRSRFGGLG